MATVSIGNRKQNKFLNKVSGVRWSGLHIRMWAGSNCFTFLGISWDSYILLPFGFSCRNKHGHGADVLKESFVKFPRAHVRAYLLKEPFAMLGPTQNLRNNKHEQKMQQRT